MEIYWKMSFLGYLEFFGGFEAFETILAVYECVLYFRLIEILRHEYSYCKTSFMQVEQFGIFFVSAV